MSDASSVALPPSLTLIQPLGASLTPPDPPLPPSQEHINVNAPAFISPAISFDPVTDVVIFTYRNSETGKITEQVPPSAVVSRYRAAEETGVPLPAAKPPAPITPPAPPAKAAPATPDTTASSSAAPTPSPSSTIA